jgi:DNA-binding CsgD family transcriptional regulator
MLECLAWAQQGKNANEIGLIIGISGRTVEKHIGHAFEVLGVRSRVQAILRARELGLLGPPQQTVQPSRSFQQQNRPRARRRTGS